MSARSRGVHGRRGGVYGSRGTALIVTVVFMGVFIILAGTLYTLMRSTIQETLYQRKRAQATALAEAGLEHGLLQLKYSAFCGASSYSKDLDYGSYSVTLTPTEAISLSSAVVNGVAIDVTSAGEVSGVMPWGSVHRKLSLRIQPGTTQFADGFFATVGDVVISSEAVVDSYDSVVDLDPSVFGSSALVSSNDQILFGSTTTAVYGDAHFYNTPEPSTSQVTGATVQMLIQAGAPWSPLAVDLECNDNSTGITPSAAYNSGTGALSVTGAVTIDPGSYDFSSITITSAGSLTTTGSERVQIHISGGITAEAS